MTVTYHVVLPFIREPETGELVAEEGHEAPSAAAALARAQAIAESKAGVVAFTRTGDPDLGEFDDAVILARLGDTPEDLADFTSIA